MIARANHQEDPTPTDRSAKAVGVILNHTAAAGGGTDDRDTSYVSGSRQDGTDRSDLALQNVRTTGSVTLLVTVTSGDPSSSGSLVLTPEQALGPGGFYQYNGIRRAASPTWTNGWVRLERVSGTAPYNG